MDDEQKKAVGSLRRALNKCAKAGLSGGIFDTKFCVWPSKLDPGMARSKGDYFDFFEAVDDIGQQISCDMHLDGGAGN